jgi:UDP-N-acetylenolpyruvoylglucosamine reductase
MNIISAKIKIKYCNINIDEIKTRIKDKIILRNKKIPMENTLGSVFKNIIINNKKNYAWCLIDELNLRGCIINNILINNNHPNIFINNSNASPDDFSALIDNISNNVFKKKSILLEKEIEYIN